MNARVVLVRFERVRVLVAENELERAVLIALESARDTECIAEMKALKDIDMAFVCMNLPYTMTPEEAGECAAAFKPKVLIPYHYRGQDPSKIESKLSGSGVTLERLRFY